MKYLTGRLEKLRTVYEKHELERFAAAAALVTVFFISAMLSSEYFLKSENLINILRQVSYTGVIALGMTFIIISGGIDLSVGSLVALNGIVTITIMNKIVINTGNQSLAIVVAISSGLAFGLLCGAFNGLMITIGKIAPFIATLGTMAIFRSLSLHIAEAGEVSSFAPQFGGVGRFTLGKLPAPVFIFIILTASLHFILNNTRYGSYLKAVGTNDEVARSSAINVNQVRFITYTIGGGLVAVSATLLASRFNAVSSSNTGLLYELDAIAAVIIGGTAMTGGRGSVWGTFCGAVILGIINNMLNMMEVSPYIQGAVKGAVIIGAVYIQRQEK